MHLDFSKYAAYDVDARNLRSLTDAFRLFPDLVLKVLVRHGLGKMEANGKMRVEAADWYPLNHWLESYYEIADRIGVSKAYDIGKHVIKNAALPPTLNDIFSAMASLDVAYHMNHRHQGRVMFEAGTGEMLDGIGHYRVIEQSPTQVTVVVEDVPYPCDVDRGVLTGFATRFEPRATVTHTPDTGCRRLGSARCTYRVEW